MQIEKTKLQLVGVTCMKIAEYINKFEINLILWYSVFNEKSKEYYKQENANEYAYITADEYNPQQLIEMEKIILNLLQFKLNSPTCIHFVKIYASYLGLPEKVFSFAKVIIFLNT